MTKINTASDGPLASLQRLGVLQWEGITTWLDTSSSVDRLGPLREVLAAASAARRDQSLFRRLAWQAHVELAGIGGPAAAAEALALTAALEPVLMPRADLVGEQLGDHGAVVRALDANQPHTAANRSVMARFRLASALAGRAAGPARLGVPGVVAGMAPHDLVVVTRKGLRVGLPAGASLRAAQLLDDLVAELIARDRCVLTGADAKQLLYGSGTKLRLLTGEKVLASDDLAVLLTPPDQSDRVITDPLFDAMRVALYALRAARLRNVATEIDGPLRVRSIDRFEPGDRAVRISGRLVDAVRLRGTLDLGSWLQIDVPAGRTNRVPARFRCRWPSLSRFGMSLDGRIVDDDRPHPGRSA